MTREAETRRGARRARGEPPAPASEWAVASVSALLVASAVGFVIYKEITIPDTPPILDIEVTWIFHEGDWYVVEFAVHNHGGTTAQGLTLTGAILDDTGAILEERSASITFLPPDSKRIAGLFFSEDPREHELRIWPEGYDHP